MDNPLLTLVVDVFAAVLGREQVDPGVSLFDLGGHSLLAARVAWRLAEVLDREVTVAAVFENPKAVDLAAWLDLQSSVPSAAIEPGSGANPSPLSFAQERLWFVEQFAPGTSTYVVAARLRLRE